MERSKRKLPAVIAAALVIATLMVAGSGIAVASGPSIITDTPVGESVHEKIDISEITGEIAEPPMLTSAASVVAAEKEWYEYVYYSGQPVAHYYVNDNTRLTFYDPYDYASSLVMEVDDSITDWSSMNTLQVSYTTGDSMVKMKGTSTQTTTSTLLGYTDTETTTVGANTVTTTTSNRTESYNTSKTTTVTEDNSKHWGSSETITTGSSTEANAGFDGIIEASVTTSIDVDIGLTQNWVTGEVTSTTTVEGTDKKKPNMTGYTLSNDEVKVETGAQTTTITNTIADRTTEATGYSSNSTVSLETNNSTTITKTYDAGYFNAAGAPLQWKIVKYTVCMPMKYQVEYLVDDEWIHGDYNYCLLNTIQGTCRAWLQNNVAYYEHWGTGEPVTWDEFWSQFFTKESLMQAYQNKLYPDY